MKNLLIILVVVASMVGVGTQFLISPVMTAYEMCQTTKQDKMAKLSMPADQLDLVEYCTSSREALDDVSDCYDQVEKINSVAPYLVQYKQDTADSLQLAVTKHHEKCPNFPLDME